MSSLEKNRPQWHIKGRSPVCFLKHCQYAMSSRTGEGTGIPDMPGKMFAPCKRQIAIAKPGAMELLSLLFLHLPRPRSLSNRLLRAIAPLSVILLIFTLVHSVLAILRSLRSRRRHIVGTCILHLRKLLRRAPRSGGGYNSLRTIANCGDIHPIRPLERRS